MIEEAIEYFRKQIEKEYQICNLPTCDKDVKAIKQKKIEYMELAISAIARLPKMD